MNFNEHFYVIYMLWLFHCSPFNAIVNVGSHILSIYLHSGKYGALRMNEPTFFARSTGHGTLIIFQIWAHKYLHGLTETIIDILHGNQRIYRFFFNFCNPLQVIRADTNEFLPHVYTWTVMQLVGALTVSPAHQVFHLSTTLGVKDMWVCSVLRKDKWEAEEKWLLCIKNRRINCVFILHLFQVFTTDKHTDTHSRTHRPHRFYCFYVLMTCWIYLISPVVMRQYCRLFLTTVKAIQSESKSKPMCIMHLCLRSTLHGHVVHRSSLVCIYKAHTSHFQIIKRTRIRAASKPYS